MVLVDLADLVDYTSNKPVVQFPLGTLSFKTSDKLLASHCSRRGPRLDFGYNQKFQHQINRQEVGFQKIRKLKSSRWGP